jgi:hypothetical protein
MESLLMKLVGMLFGEGAKQYPKTTLLVLALLIAGIIFLFWISR